MSEFSTTRRLIIKAPGFSLIDIMVESSELSGRVEMGK